jgi:hypothetical protein
MATIPLKPQYGPTLGTLLAPRWHAAPRAARILARAAGVGLVALAIAAALTLWPAGYSHGGPAPFHFSYRSLYRTTPEQGQYVRIDRRDDGGRLENSFAVSPLHLPPYSGGLSGELPVYASGYIDRLRAKFTDFALRGEGKTRVNTVPAYNIFYTTRIEGREMYGRDVLLLPAREGVRNGVALEMLTLPSPSLTSPLEVATAGVLERPVETFTIS